MGGNSYIFLKSGILTRYSFRFLCNFLVYKMAKHGKQLPDDTKNTIVQLIEGSYQASEVANILNISKSTISKLLKRWRERGDTENKPRKGRSKFVSKRGERVLNRIAKTSRRATLKDITSEFNRTKRSV